MAASGSPVPNPRARCPGRVLVVDDDPKIRDILRQYLEDEGHSVLEADNGLTAVAMAGRDSPDLVLLDLAMPGMSGQDVLARMKSDPASRGVPVLVLTGSGDLAKAEDCLLKGAEDFAQKPFQWPLLRARIESCLQRRFHEKLEEDYRRRVEGHNLELDAAVRARTRELEDAHRRLADLDRAKDDFITLIGHELRTPVTGLMASCEILAGEGLSDADRGELAGIATAACDRLGRIVEDALLLARIRVGRDVPPAAEHPLGPILERAAATAGGFARSRGVEIATPGDPAVRIRCDADLLGNALGALVECVVKFCSRGSRVALEVEEADGVVRVFVRGSGGSISPEVRDRFFGIFSVVEPLTPGGDLGLGPALAARILGLFDGSVAVQPVEEGGVSLAVTLRALPGN